MDSFTNMKSSCNGTNASHQEVKVCSQICGQGAQWEGGGDAGGGAEEGAEGQEESVRHQDHEQRVGGNKIPFIQLNITDWQNSSVCRNYGAVVIQAHQGQRWSLLAQ